MTFEQAIKTMLEKREGFKNEFEKIISYEGYTKASRNKAVKDYEMVKQVFGKIPNLCILHDLQSPEVLRDVVYFMMCESEDVRRN